MDTPPVPATIATTNSPATAIQLSYPDSVDTSPRSRIAETWADEHLHPLPGAKLRLMCSYGGHIMPRPHDKSLCYVGGDTRIVVVDRHSSLKDICSRLSRAFLHGRPFNLKYQLPNEDLDNLISVSTDEDLENMIEEYDRITAPSPLKPARLRLFLFFIKPETAVSMGSLLDDGKSETWFVDALNNSGLPRVVSDSAAGDCLVNLDGVPASDSSNNLEAQAAESLADNTKQEKNLPDMHSMPNSPMVENNSSCGSSSSNPSMANLPPIWVRVDENGSRLQQEQRPGMEEQFAQMTFGANVMKPHDGYGILSAPMPPIPTTVVTMASPAIVTGENMHRVISDDERSDQGAPAGYRKPPLPFLPVQPRTISGGFGAGVSLPSPDSVARVGYDFSDSSIASANSISKPVYYQDQVHAVHVENKVPAVPTSKSEMSDHPNPGIQRKQQIQEYASTLPPQLEQNQQLQQQQQQYVHASTHYIHHPAAAATGPVPVSSYYPVYAPPSQQQLHHPIGQQYPVYVMPVGPTQAYNMALQANMADPNVVASSARLVVPQSAAPPAAYKDGTPPIYPAKSAIPTLPEITPNIYKAPAASSQAFVQIPSSQFRQQYVGVPQIHHPPQVASSAPANHGYEYSVSAQDQAYYTQQQTVPLPLQYQSMTPAAAAAALSDANKQFPADDINQRQN